METITKQDKLLFFGITFVALAAFGFIINYVSPITGFGLPHIVILTFIMAAIITLLKYDSTKVVAWFKSIHPNLISGIIWSTLAIMKWVKYFNKDNFDWIIASLFTIVAIINWVGFLENLINKLLNPHYDMEKSLNFASKPINRPMEFSFGHIFTKAYWKETAIPFAKKHWIIILAVLTAISVAHTIWYFTIVKTLPELVTKFQSLELARKGTKLKVNAFWYKLGYLYGAILKSKSFIFSLVGTTILIAEFNYQFLFKNLFVDEGRKGKFFYFLVLLFFYFFILIILLSTFGVKAEPLGLHTFITNVWIGFSVIYSVIQYVSESHKRLREMAIQKTKVELSALKAQINPHFLFNVLNNLYGTAIVEDSPKTAEGIQQLSSIMRHVVEGTKNERISAEKEVQFLYDFVELNKMRIPKRDNIRINVSIDWDEQPTQIAPLLVIPYIENAFKYGISITQESFIDLNFKIKDQKLSFSCRNSIIKQFDKLEVGTSTGLENTKRRLMLNYPHKHSLKISNENTIFEVALEVNLK